MKTCKDCGKEVSKSAKNCPNCGKKLKKPIVLFIILGIIIIGGISAALASKEEEARKKEYNQNETATYKDVDYSITKVERTQGSNEFLKPKEGYEYIVITLKIENKSKEKISYNSIDWKVMTSDGAEDTFSSLTVEDYDTNLSVGELNPNGTKTGTISYEIPKGDKVVLKYYETIIDSTRTFEFKIND